VWSEVVWECGRSCGFLEAALRAQGEGERVVKRRQLRVHACLRLQRQYLYSCTSTASKVSTDELDEVALGRL
jgi:hypothetical protein